MSIWKESFKLWPTVFKRAWLWLIFTAVVAIGFDLVLETLKKLDDKLALLVGLISLIITLFLEAFSTIIISQIVLDAREKITRSLAGSVKSNIKLVFIETTRALVPIILKSILFIIPGLVEAVRLFFVAYVVQFDAGYKSGQVDALERSRSLVRGKFWYITFCLLVTTVVTMAPSVLRGRFSFSETPVFYGLTIILGMVFECYADTLIYLLYTRLADLKQVVAIPPTTL